MKSTFDLKKIIKKNNQPNRQPVETEAVEESTHPRG